MQNYPFEIISSSSSVTQAFAKDNSIINTRNVDRIPPAEVALHSHPYYSIIYVADCDRFTTYIDGCAINFLPKHAYFLPPNTLHSPKNQFSGMFSSISLKLYIRDMELADTLGFHPFCVLCDDGLSALFHETTKISQKANNSKLISLYKLTSEILSSLSASNRHQLVKDEDNFYDSSFINVLKYMYIHCDEEIDLGELAKIAHMERTAFAKKFKLMYKITPINYLYSIRLSRSLDLLMSPEISISKIARDVGFKRATAFSSAFTRAYGMTPTEYRERLAKLESSSLLRPFQ